MVSLVSRNPCLRVAVVVSLLLATVLPATDATYLETYQLQLGELHERMVTGIGSRFGENSALGKELVEQGVLPLVAEGTVAIRGANRELVEGVAALRPNETSDDCWSTVDSLVYLYTQFAQWDLQDCVYGGYSQWLRYDASERFNPRAQELHRTSSDVISAIVEVLSEDNPVADAANVEGRLDANLDHFNELWIDGDQDLAEELDRHPLREEALGEYMRQCIDRTIEASRDDVLYTIAYAETICV
ncbi:uncharacterized protein LOC118456797 [Anopheles albimanus]|uniref:Uncharacterized protein n=1 Tax=Anopheles albimanus TaxID=7167 RepID=A0A182FPZ6_ANOAL|nr:uncharacterized protein LOC118456797 [Anopheles albimanus]